MVKYFANEGAEIKKSVGKLRFLYNIKYCKKWLKDQAYGQLQPSNFLNSELAT